MTTTAAKEVSEGFTSVVLPKSISKKEKTLRFVVISDTHNLHDMLPKLPVGDVLIHAGDFTKRGTIFEVIAFNQFLGKIKHLYKYIIVVPGNHDVTPDLYGPLLTNCTFYLLDKMITIPNTNVTVYGTRFKPYLSIPRKYEYLAKKSFQEMPANVDILITQPADGAMDTIWNGESRGNKPLASEIRKKLPKVHVFGHNHNAYGSMYQCIESEEKFKIVDTLEGTEVGQEEAATTTIGSSPVHIITHICAASIDGHQKNKTLRKPIVFDFEH